MEIINSKKDPPDQGGLRLVPELPLLAPPKLDRQFVNFMFFRVDPEWRRLEPEIKRDLKDEFSSIYESFREHFLLFSYSLVGFDSKADLMLWRIGRSLDLIQEMTARLYRTRLGSYLETVDNYLSVTKKRIFVTDSAEDRAHVNAGEKKYLFVYPCSKSRDLPDKSDEERDSIIEDNFMVGKRFSNIKIHMTHAFGFGDQDYIISFETDEPKDFLALAEELREAPSSKFMLRGMPVYTCRQKPLDVCLDAIG